MKHLPTTVLLDLAEDYNNIATKFIVRSDKSGGGYLSALEKLASIDTELLSRMPEGEFVTVYDYLENDYLFRGHSVEFLPIGFEPYMPNEDEAWLFDALYGHIDGVPTVEG